MLELLAALTTPAIALVLVSRYGSLSEMAKAPMEELQTIAGVGPKKALQIQAAFELARVLSRETALDQPYLDTPERIASLFREEARVYTVEIFQVILLNTRRRLLKIVSIAQGTLDSVNIHAREVFKTAISMNASALVLAHNHPSGSCEPSEADVRVTRDLVRAGQLLRIEVLDHIVLGRATAEQPKDYFSFKEAGYMYE